MIARLVLPVILVSLTLGCGAPDSGPTPSSAAEPETIERRAADILSRMTLEEKVGQIIQADISAVTPEQAREYNLGSILNGGNSAPGGGKVAEPEEWVALADAFWLASTDTSDGGVGVPLLWGTDAVHGHNNLQTATIFPHNIGLGAANDPALLAEIAEVTAREIRATGLDWTFAPTLAVARDDRWGRTYESYSENPEVVAAYAEAMVRGLQGNPQSDDFLIGENVMATAKHFIGDGGTRFGIDKGDTVGEWDEILRVHGAGYAPAIGADVQAVMASFSSVNGVKMHGAGDLLTGVLREELGFDGFVVGDWDGHAEVPGCSAEDCPEALYAGIDMYMAPGSWEGLYTNLLDDARSGELDLERLDEAVLRILTVKLRSGLFEAGLPSERPATSVEILGNPDHRAVARRAVRQSLVLLKNADGVLPIRPGANILVTGSGADSMEQQTGGWTLNWQGTGNANHEFVHAETIFEGIRAAAEEGGGRVNLSVDGNYETAPDVAIVVFGEEPYAEYRGDRADLVYEFNDGEDLARLRTLKAADIPTVAVFLTGRPLWVNPHLNSADAFVVAWLPGTEGGGVADVLVGDDTGAARYDFTGRLSFSWPSDGTGTPINGPEDDGVLFPFGYGLSYSNTVQWTTLDEEPGIEPQDFDGQIFVRGDAAAGLTMFLGDSSNANVPLLAMTGESFGGIVMARGVDYQAQEDSRRFSWSGTDDGTVSIRPGRAIDLTDFAAGEPLVLDIEWNIEVPPAGEFFVGMTCGDGCRGAVDLGDHLRAQPSNQWITTAIAVDCLVDEGLALDNVTSPMFLSTEGTASVTLYSVVVRPSSDADQACIRSR